MRIHGLCVLVACLALTAQADPVRLVNVSTRMQVLTGNDVMIAGFVVGGSASKTIAIVASGPSLAQFGIANALANPMVTLVRSSDQAVIATNDDWQSASNAAAVQASGFAPSNALEAAILVPLDPGAYTAILAGVGGTTGIGILGVYEAALPADTLAPQVSTTFPLNTALDMPVLVTPGVVFTEAMDPATLNTS